MISEKDKKILEILKFNCKIPSWKMSEKTGIPITTIHNRIKKLEKDGIIKGYKAIVDNKKLGKNIQAYVTFSVAAGPRFSEENVAKRVIKMPEVEECAVITGSSDILIKVSTKDVDELNDFVINNLRTIKGAKNTTTAIILKEITDKE